MSYVLQGRRLAALRKERGPKHDPWGTILKNNVLFSPKRINTMPRFMTIYRWRYDRTYTGDIIEWYSTAVLHISQRNILMKMAPERDN